MRHIAAVLVALGLTAGLRATAQVRVEPPPYEQPQAGDTQINGNGVRQSVACRGNALYVQGQENQVEVHGDCRLVRIQGNRNMVSVDRRTLIAVEGNANFVIVGDAKTQVSERGDRNRFEKKSGARLPPLDR